MKFLLLVGLLAVIWLMWKKHQARRAPPPMPPAERMVSCRQCGLLMPESDSIKDGGEHFCCEAHRQAARPAERQ